MKETKGTTLLSNSIIGNNDEYLFVEALNYNSIAYDRTYSKSIKINIVKKTDLSIVRSVEIYNKSNPIDKKYYVTNYTVSDNKIFVFYRDRKEKKFRGIYVKTFDMTWNPTSEIRELYKIPVNREFRKVNFIFSISSSSNYILSGAEFPAEKGGSPYVDYIIYETSGFDKVGLGKFELPVKINSKKASTSNSKFFVTNKGNIMFRTTISIDKEEQKNLKEGEDAYYTTMSYVDAKTSDIKTIPIKFQGKNVFYTQFFIEESRFKLIGFYSDLDDDKTGNKISGIFTAFIGQDKMELEGAEFKRFSKEDLLKLYKYDLNDKKQAKKADQITDQNAALSSDLIIENIRTEDNGDVYLFCNHMNNYTRQVCTGRGAQRTCELLYYCLKRDTYIFKIEASGKLGWIKWFNRGHTFNEWYVYDQQVFKSNNKFFVTYTTDNDYDSTLNNLKKSRRPKLSRNQRLEYIAIDIATGNAERKYFHFNSPDSKKSSWKTLNPASMRNIGSELYGVQNSFYTPTGIQVMNTIFSITLPYIYYYLIRPSIKESTYKSRTEYVKVTSNQ
jgi:hypothetical protein